jgi:phage tail-like protein
MTPKEILSLLPQVIQRTCPDPEDEPGNLTNPLSAIIEVMCVMLDPIDTELGRFEIYLDPRRAREEFVPMLARWVDLDRLFEPVQGDVPLPPRMLFPAGIGRLRELVAGATKLSQMRGTRDGLIAFLETATGVKGFDIDEIVQDAKGLPIPFHIRVRSPEAARPLDRLVRRIIDSERPAYVTYDLSYS